MKPPSTFDTSRLHLRPPVISDAEAIFTSYAQDKEVTKYMTWLPHPTIEVTREFIHRCIASWEDESAFAWVISLREDNRLLGLVDLRIGSFMADFGYVITRNDWGKGFATEAVQEVVGWAIEQPSIYRVWAVCDVENLASARVLEKVGMEKEGILRRYGMHSNVSKIPRDVLCYSIVKS